jgi:transcriptional regulator with XRE-family HTH domain
MPIDTQYFKDRLADRRMSQRELARKLGIDHSAVSLMLRGKRRMTLTEAADIARLIGAPASEVIAHAGVRMDSDGAMVSIAGWMDGTGEVHSLEAGDSVPIPSRELPCDTMAVQCRTSGGDLEHMDGWILFSAMPRGFDPAAIGRTSLVRLRNGQMRIGFVKRSYKTARYSLALSASVLTDADLEWATPIIFIRT